MISTDAVAGHLRAIWMRQGVQNPADRDAVFERFMKSAPAKDGSPNNHGRGALKAAFDEAVAALTAAFGADAPPDDPVVAVWLAFPKLDLAHRTELAALLMQERADGEI